VRICLISVEIFAWGKYGGFGRATRLIGRELVKRGLEVFAVVPKRAGQRTFENLDGIKVFGFKPGNPISAIRFFEKADADIYHSCEPSFGTYLAMKTMPLKKHIVTCRDPRDFNDWMMEFKKPSLNKIQVIFNYIYENNFFVRNSIKRMDGVFTTAKYLIPKVTKMYSLENFPEFLPTPVEMPNNIEKAKTPTVCYVARFDRRKRPEIFLQMARRFPQVTFIAVGKSRNEKWDLHLRRTYANIPNLNLVGFVDQFSTNLLSEIYQKSWILINTATREGLANTFIEAAANKCAILSAVDPDEFSSKFGYWAQKDDFDRGLEYLLHQNNWKEKGERGHEYIRKNFELSKAIDLHIQEYRRTLKIT
jgi:glycosyltransferase involved in cell wall biosynthesis